MKKSYSKSLEQLFKIISGVFLIGLSLFLNACSSNFSVKSDPAQADVFFVNPKTGEKKIIGKTPLLMPNSELKTFTNGTIPPGEFFTVSVEKQGFQNEVFLIPALKFGTTLTALDVKMKNGVSLKEEKTAKSIIDHLFLAQKLALTQQYERAHIEVDQILKEFPNFARAMTMRASIYYAQKNFKESLKWYDEALKVDPQMDETVKMAAKVRSLASGEKNATK